MNNRETLDDLEWYDGESTLPISDQAKLADLTRVADEILAAERRDNNITKFSEMKDYLSPGQLANRISREVYTGSGTPDPSIHLGVFSRPYYDRDMPNDLRTMGPNDIMPDDWCSEVTVSYREDDDGR